MTLENSRNETERQFHSHLQAVEAKNYEKLEMISRMAKTKK